MISNYKTRFRYKYARKFLRGKSVLDIGCGWGEGLKYLKGLDITGIDRDDEFMGMLKKNNPDVTVYKQIFPPLNFPSNSFDNAILCEVIEHIPEKEAIRLIQEIRRVLRKDGIFYMTTPIRENREYWAEKSKPRHEDDYRKHQKEYSIEEMRKLIVSAGFRVIKQSTFNMSLFGKMKKINKVGRYQDENPKSNTAIIWKILAPIGRFVQINLGRIFKRRAEYQIWVLENVK